MSNYGIEGELNLINIPLSTSGRAGGCSEFQCGMLRVVETTVARRDGQLKPLSL